MSVAVLLADDHDLVVDAVGEALVAAGQQVVATVGSGRAALDAAREHAPDVVVLDLGMPGSGPDLVRALRALRPAPQVVVFSGRDDADTVLDVLAAGATAYAVKGGLAGDFAECVARAAQGDLLVLGSCASEVRQRLVQAWASRPSVDDALAGRPA